MLGKLVKHEWRSTYRMGCLMLFITLMVTFLGWLSFQSPMWRQLREDDCVVVAGDAVGEVELFVAVFEWLD